MLRIGTVLFISALMTPAHAAVPVTQRLQDMTFNSSEVNAYARNAYDTILNQQRQAGLLDKHVHLLTRIRRIAAPILDQARALKYTARLWDWEIHLTSSPEIDAFCMAGGKILVSERFIHRFQLSDDELAVVLAHEIAHALAEHVREQLSEAQLRQPRYPYHSVSDASHDLNSDFGLYLRLGALSRMQEREADTIGIALARRAGVPLHAALSFYRKLARNAHENANDPGLSQTHPDAQSRLLHVQHLIETVYAQPEIR